jgi:hypothetical protein
MYSGAIKTRTYIMIKEKQNDPNIMSIRLIQKMINVIIIFDNTDFEKFEIKLQIIYTNSNIFINK